MVPIEGNGRFVFGVDNQRRSRIWRVLLARVWLLSQTAPQSKLTAYCGKGITPLELISLEVCAAPSALILLSAAIREHGGR